MKMLFTAHVQSLAQGLYPVAVFGGLLEFKLLGGGPHGLFQFGDELGDVARALRGGGFGCCFLLLAAALALGGLGTAAIMNQRRRKAEAQENEG